MRKRRKKEWERWVKQQGTEAGFVEMAKTLKNPEDLISQKCLVCKFLLIPKFLVKSVTPTKAFTEGCVSGMRVCMFVQQRLNSIVYGLG